MNVIKKRLLEEPAYAGAVLIAAVSLIGAFATTVSAEQLGAVVAFIAIVTGASVRRVVSPTNGE